MPTIKEIAADPQFEPEVVEKHAFERKWAAQHGAA
jgi:hypothetical protein